MHPRVRIALVLALGGMCALALASTVRARAGAQSAAFDLTLAGDVTKTWEYRVVEEQAECVTTTRVEGLRTIALRSARPTRTRVTLDRGRARFRPSLLRNVTVTATSRGTVTKTESGSNGCRRGTTRTTCSPVSTRWTGQTARFFLSARNEVSFRPTRDYARSVGCPPEPADVVVEKPGIHQAEGELDVAALFGRRYRVQTALGSFRETTELDGDPVGTVVARVSWSLRLARR